MKFGLLWYNNDPKKSVETKIKEAKDYYESKYKTKPDTCIVNPNLPLLEKEADPSTNEGDVQEIELCGLKIKRNKMVMINHFLIGKDSDTKKPEVR